ncbi:MAG: hypothetical protein AB7N69_02435 [Immundisolibacter sp.]|uniref:hypothetical protein n=1 Tax=Immundisolibacter sp. TaxID=1934948 RepID=UPI003D0B78B0
MTPQDVARFVMRRVLPFKERKRRAALKSALSELALQTQKSTTRDFEASTVILNIALFLLITERDIQALKIDALTHPDKWHRSLCTRVILLTVHGRDIDKVAGQKLRQALETIKAPDDMKRAANESLRTLRRVQKKAESDFEFLRNATIAHRDPDALTQYRSILQIDEMKVLNLAAEFSTAATAFITLLPNLFLQSGTLPSIVNQFSQREKKNAASRSEL